MGLLSCPGDPLRCLGSGDPLSIQDTPSGALQGPFQSFALVQLSFQVCSANFANFKIHLLLLLLRLKTCEKPGEASVAVPKLTISEFYKYSYASAYRISQERRAHSFLPEIVIKVCLIYMRYMNIFFTCTHTDPHPRNTLSVHSWLTSYVRNRIKDEVKRPKVPSTRSEDFKYNIYCILYEDNDIPFFVQTTSFDP